MDFQIAVERFENAANQLKKCARSGALLSETSESLVSRVAPQGFNASRHVDETTRTIRGVVVSSDELDLHRSRVEQNFEFDRVKLLADHSHGVDDLIGEVLNIRPDRIGKVKVTRADLVFGSDQRSQALFQKFSTGPGTDVSVGFIPLSYREPTDEEHDQGIVEVVTKSRLLEVSLVSIGSNRLSKVRSNPIASALLSQAESIRMAARSLSSAPGARNPSGQEATLLQARLVAIRAQLSTMR